MSATCPSGTKRRFGGLGAPSLAPGAIIELPKPAEDELEVLVNNKTVGTGLAVKVGENFGVRVAFIGDLKQRILALGQPLHAGAELVFRQPGSRLEDAQRVGVAVRLLLVLGELPIERRLLTE